MAGSNARATEHLIPISRTKHRLSERIDVNRDRPSSAESQDLDHPFPAKPRVGVTSGARRVLYLMLGLTFLALGLLGVVLPGLPTTPFLLLMSFFLLRSSPALHRRALGIPVVGTYLRDWETHHGVRRHVKWLAYLMITVALLLLGTTSQIGPMIKIPAALLVAVGVFVVWRLPIVSSETCSSSDPTRSESDDSERQRTRYSA